MEKQRRIKVLSLVALIIAVLGLTVAFAALSQTLTINGRTSVDASTWDIHFKESQTPTEIIGAATFTEPSITGTRISGLDVTITKPGDSVTYYFDIVNNGNLDAEIDKYILPKKIAYCLYKNLLVTPECKDFDFNDDGFVDMTDSSVFISLFSYNIYYVDTNKEILEGDKIKAGDTKHAKIVVKYNDTATELPSSDITLTTGEDIVINYIQTE